MKTEPTSKDVYWIAKGCWEHYFNWKVHPATKPDWMVAFITGGIGLAILILGAVFEAVSDIVTSGPSLVFSIGIILLLVGVAWFLKGQHTYNREKQDYIDYAVDRWEHGDKALPSLESLKNWAPGFEKPRHEGV